MANQFKRAAIYIAVTVFLSPTLTAVMHAQLLQEYTDTNHRLVRVYRSPDVWSGHGADYGAWALYSTPPTPDGYKLYMESFSLGGDRRCAGGDAMTYPVQTHIPFIGTVTIWPGGMVYPKIGAVFQGEWAQCSLTVRGETGVEWSFRMQGHDEDTSITVDKFRCCDGSLSIDFKREHGAATSIGIITVVYEKPQ